MGKLTEIQYRLNAPKNQYNTFGKYKFRSCEDILEGLKGLLKEFDCVVTFNDEIVQVGNRIYVKTTAYLKEYYVTEGENAGYEALRIIDQSSAFAREPEKQSGMQDGQLTGSTSTYARKYALNGLFAIDDAKDADTDEHHNNSNNRPDPKKNVVEKVQPVNDWASMIRDILMKVPTEKAEDYRKLLNNKVMPANKTTYDKICKDNNINA